MRNLALSLTLPALFCLVLVALWANDQRPVRIDATTQEALEASLKRLDKQLDDKTMFEFQLALQRITSHELPGDTPYFIEESQYWAACRKVSHGKTAAEIIQEAERLPVGSRHEDKLAK